MAQWVKDLTLSLLWLSSLNLYYSSELSHSSDIVTAMAQLTAVIQVQCLAQEFSYATDVAKKEKKKELHFLKF